MLIVRIDDVLVHSGKRGSFQGREFARFKQIHGWLSAAPKIIEHRPAVLVKEIQAFPEAIEFVKDETKHGRMVPVLHGLEHIDYGRMPKAAIKYHLERSLEWFDSALEFRPTIFATPWGADSPAIRDACAEVGMVAETTRGTLTPAEVCAHLRKGTSFFELNGAVILEHWWQKGLRLWRIAQAAKHGSWEAAAEVNGDAFL